MVVLAWYSVNNIDFWDGSGYYRGSGPYDGHGAGYVTGCGRCDGFRHGFRDDYYPQYAIIGVSA